MFFPRPFPFDSFLFLFIACPRPARADKVPISQFPVSVKNFEAVSFRFPEVCFYICSRRKIPKWVLRRFRFLARRSPRLLRAVQTPPPPRRSLLGPGTPGAAAARSSEATRTWSWRRCRCTAGRCSSPHRSRRGRRPGGHGAGEGGAVRFQGVGGDLAQGLFKNCFLGWGFLLLEI